MRFISWFMQECRRIFVRAPTRATVVIVAADVDTGILHAVKRLPVNAVQVQGDNVVIVVRLQTLLEALVKK